MESSELVSVFENYIKELKKHSLSDITEHSHRPDLLNLLNSIAKEKNKKIDILHEPKRHPELGAPDFKISLNESIIGYVENKKIEEDLDKTLKSDQIKRYKELSDNILITNYIEWIWLKKGETIQRETLCYKTDIESKRFKPDKIRIEAVNNLIKNFLSQPPIGLARAKDLANALAVRGRWLRDFLRIELHRQEKEHQEGKLFGLYSIFRTNIHIELTLDEFADAFSQTLVYGLFLAKLNALDEKVSLENAKRFIPISFELIKELVDFLDELDKDEYKEIRWIVEEVLSIMNNLNLNSLQESLSYKNWHRTLSKDMKDIVLKDPYVYFYEDFLAAYDKKMRKAKGVYYTPPPVVSFIIRAIDDILIDKFGIKDGFADRQKVTVLDFATGTGTFLLDIFENIFEKLPQKSGKHELIVKEHLLKNIFGFEYLIAPYTIAHLKLSQFLADNGYRLSKGERLQVYLTNTLEPLIPVHNAFVPALYEEGKKAKDIKEKPILVITGNPPYKGHSQNPSYKIVKKEINKETKYIKELTWIGKEIENYKIVDGKKLHERNPKWLQDDYVKFIRFAQLKMEQVDEGIVGIITNHSFLDNPTFKGMRQSLINTFHEIYFLDLHGNVKKKEKNPEGGKDENVFDVKPGVCISIFLKSKIDKSSESNLCKLYHAEIWGLRNTKYSYCLSESIKNIKWTQIFPKSPDYIFKPQSKKLKKIFDSFIHIKDIFMLSGNGIVTKRDKLVVGKSENELIYKLSQFNNPEYSDDKIKELFNIPLKDKDKWDMRKAREYLNSSGIDENKIVRIHYRIFDKRYLYQDKILVARLVKDISTNFSSNYSVNNISLILGRAGHNVDQSTSWNLVFASDLMTDINLFYRGGATNFLLYIKNTQAGGFFVSDSISNEYIENINIEFRNFIDNKYNHRFTPEKILGYIYAVLHSPTYRKKYAEFLKSDFPRIPFPDNKREFEKLSSLGWELTQVHIMKDLGIYLKEINDIGNYSGNGNNEVVKVEYLKDIKTKLFRIKINPDQYFDNIPEEIFNFYIGGYQVLDKYLKDRKGRTLTLDEIENVEKVVKIIRFTIEQMKKIDKETKDWI